MTGTVSTILDSKAQGTPAGKMADLQARFDAASASVKCVMPGLAEARRLPSRSRCRTPAPPSSGSPRSEPPVLPDTDVSCILLTRRAPR